MKLIVTFLIVFMAAAFNTHQIIKADEPEKLQYNRDIRPIFAENCFHCHGADKAKREAELRLDDRTVSIETQAIVPGNPDASKAIERILSSNKDEVMPPLKSHKKLSNKQIEILKRWIAEGAEYQPHWAFIKPEKTPVPQVKNKDWVKSPIDAFILAKLESLKLEPAPQADKYTLARRVSLDLTGLPPSQELLDNFIKDNSAEAYEKYVDKLLDSPQYGEHRARYWLDMARYGDTHGIHFDNFREMWTYRDWVINSFNKNMRYDQFTIEQLAGDLIPDATLEQKIASGFHRCNITTNEGGIIDEEYKVLYARDRTETTAAVWMGMTAGCAVCHNHKYDPFTMKDFYQMSAFFNNTTQAVKDGNRRDTPPIINVPLKSDEPRLVELGTLIADNEKAIEAYKKDSQKSFEEWFNNSAASMQQITIAEDNMHLSFPLNDDTKDKLSWKYKNETGVSQYKGIVFTKGQSSQVLKVNKDTDISLPEAGNFDSDQSFSITLWTKFNANGSGKALVSRLEDKAPFKGWDVSMENGKIVFHLINNWSDNALKIITTRSVGYDKWNHIIVTHDGSKKAVGVRVYVNGSEVVIDRVYDNLNGSTKTETPFRIGQRTNGAISLDSELYDLRLYNRLLLPSEIKQLSNLTQFQTYFKKKLADLKPEERDSVTAWWLSNVDSQGMKLLQSQQEMNTESQKILSFGSIAHIMSESPGIPKAFMLIRGEYDKHGDEVTADTPDFLPPFPENAPKNRLGFARWIMQDNQPLTTRVAVNQFWQQIFGQGIVKSAGDFGIAGMQPNNQELLDYLAVDFRESGYDIKRFFKNMVMSNAYKQSALVTTAKLNIDPDNKYVSRGPRYRMDAEMVRDYTLFASGILNKKTGGPSVKPYQPEGVWEAVAMPESNTKYYNRDSGEQLYRRSMYTLWKRAAPPASMDIFNAPSREFCVMQRERTNTPLQALVTLNDEQGIEAARFLAEKSLSINKDYETRLRYISDRILYRPLKPVEFEIIKKSFDKLSEYYQKNTEDAKKLMSVGEYQTKADSNSSELAAWTMLCNELFNLDEVLNK